MYTEKQINLMPGTANLAPRPTTWCCHLANLTAWSRSSCPSILKVSWRRLQPFSRNVVNKQTWWHRQPKTVPSWLSVPQERGVNTVGCEVCTVHGPGRAETSRPVWLAISYYNYYKSTCNVALLYDNNSGRTENARDQPLAPAAKVSVTFVSWLIVNCHQRSRSIGYVC